MSNIFAFPSHGTMGEVVEPGMNLNDYFAAKAMQAMIACKYDEPMRGYDGWRDEFAREAFRYAGSMLKAREA